MGVNGIYGLSGSGMDIESMVKVGMMSKQNEYDKMAQKYTINEWTKADYLELSNKITTFNTSTLSQSKMSNTMNAKTAESSNEAVKVEATSSAPVIDHRVDVEKLSSNAHVISTRKLVRFGSENTSTDLKNVLFQSLTLSADGTKVSGKAIDGNSLNANAEDNAIEFVLKDGTKTDGVDNQATIKFTYKEIAEGKTLTDLAAQINKSGLNIKAYYDVDHDVFSMYNTKSGEENTLSVTISGTDKVTNTYVKNAYYTRTDTWVSASTAEDPTAGSYSEGTSLLDHEDSAYPSTYIKSYSDAVSTTTAKFFNNLNLYQSKEGTLYSPGAANENIAKTDTNYWGFWTKEDTTSIYQTKTITTVTKTGGNADGTTSTENSWHTDSSSGPVTTGNNASKTVYGEYGQISVDGVLYKDVKDNQLTINGITYTALNRTNGTSAVINVSQDTDEIIDKVKSFITDYNKLLSSLYEKYDEKPNSDYKPLTQSQKDSMKDEQIEKWEAKAKSGLLYHDQTLGKIIRNLRSAISDSVELDDGSSVSVFSIGISTTGLKGQLQLDEDKLKKALANDPDMVYKVFAVLPEDQEQWSTSSKIGVAQRLGDVFTNSAKSIKNRAGTTSDITEDSDLNTLLRNLQTRMSNFKKMMNSFEDALYKKYDTMESTLARLSTQMNYIMGGSSS